MGRSMVLVIIHDVTEEFTQRQELEKKNRQIERDLAAAAGIQQGLLPKDRLDLDSVRLAWRFRPSGQIGGDFFNFHCPDDERLGLYMLDVCGHGVSAAFMATTASQFLLSRQGIIGPSGGVRAPAEVLSNLDAAFPFERFGSYMTIACATLDLGDGRFTYACAGHPPPILVEPDGSVSPLTHHGPIIGLGTGCGFTEDEVLLRKGDRVALYTDGILDARSPNGTFFGEERLVEVLIAHRARSVQATADGVWEAVQAFGRRRRPEDDISILVLEYGRIGRGRHD
jgi:sigma-B regulation protein RsbU (phosphoserine phosphatase)